MPIVRQDSEWSLVVHHRFRLRFDDRYLFLTQHLYLAVVPFGVSQQFVVEHHLFRVCCQFLLYLAVRHLLEGTVFRMRLQFFLLLFQPVPFDRE